MMKNQILMHKKLFKKLESIEKAFEWNEKRGNVKKKVFSWNLTAFSESYQIKSFQHNKSSKSFQVEKLFNVWKSKSFKIRRKLVILKSSKATLKLLSIFSNANFSFFSPLNNEKLRHFSAQHLSIVSNFSFTQYLPLFPDTLLAAAPTKSHHHFFPLTPFVDCSSM